MCRVPTFRSLPELPHWQLDERGCTSKECVKELCDAWEELVDERLDVFFHVFTF
jgi:hypothetical protein